VSAQSIRDAVRNGKITPEQGAELFELRRQIQRRLRRAFWRGFFNGFSLRYVGRWARRNWQRWRHQ
jgi:hypothetical protein